MSQNEEILFLRQENANLRQENLDLRQEFLLLKSKIEELDGKLNKTSANSSKPPSTDFIRKTVSLRGTSEKSVGGQKGHPGSTLSQRIDVDQIIVHTVEYCSCCGEDLKNVDSKHIEKHQVFELPQIAINVIEHQAQVKSCPNCAKENKASFPDYASEPTQYGTNLKAFACYLSNYQLLPYQRCSQLIEDLTGHRISPSTLVKFNTQFSTELTPFITALKQDLIQAPLLYLDETGYYYSKKRNWLHVACTELATYYYAHQKRGKEAMDQMGVLGNYQGKAMHDFWASYMDKAFEFEHYLCNVHHLRDLTFCEEHEKSNWAKEMKSLLFEIKKQVEDALIKDLQSVEKDIQEKLLSRYDALIEAGKKEHQLPEKIKGKKGRVKKTKARNLLERFDNHKESVIGFLKDITIPFGNNTAEQALRMMKLKQKISGCFRSELGAKVFADTRSYIETMRKREFDIIDAIGLAINGKAVIPFT